MIAPVNGYSCEIHGYLEVAISQYPIARLDGEVVGLKIAVNLPPGDAEIVMFYDGEMARTRVSLPKGSSTEWRTIPYRRIG